MNRIALKAKIEHRYQSDFQPNWEPVLDYVEELITAERAAVLREAADDCRELGGGTWDWTVLASRADSISTTTHDNEGVTK